MILNGLTLPTMAYDLLNLIYLAVIIVHLLAGVVATDGKTQKLLLESLDALCIIDLDLKGGCSHLHVFCAIFSIKELERMEAVCVLKFLVQTLRNSATIWW